MQILISGSKGGIGYSRAGSYNHPSNRALSGQILNMVRKNAVRGAAFYLRKEVMYKRKNSFSFSTRVASANYPLIMLPKVISC